MGFKIKILLIVMLLSFSSFVSASNKWSEWGEVGMVYTYNDPDSLYVYLKSEQCPNTKKYFSITKGQQGNAKQLISMVLTAKAAKKRIRILYDPNENQTMCYFRGLQIEE